MKNHDLAQQIELARQAMVNFSTIDFPAAIKTVATQIQQMKEFFGPDGALGEFARREVDRKRVEDAGWLPHSIIPIDLVRKSASDKADLSKSLAGYFHDHWQEVKIYFKERLIDIDISAESKATFLEALECHSRGFYRASIRLLFPQIEHEISTNFSSDGNKKAKVRDLIETVETAPVGYAIDTMSDLNLFYKLSDHMYSKVTEGNITRFKEDMVPNRHASLHGLIIYSKEQHSINTIIMADYIFRIVSKIKHNEASNEI